MIKAFRKCGVPEHGELNAELDSLLKTVRAAVWMARRDSKDESMTVHQLADSIKAVAEFLGKALPTIPPPPGTLS